MEYVVRKFGSHDEADQADREYYRSLTPQQRIELLIQMIDDYYGTEHRLERVPQSARIVKRCLSGGGRLGSCLLRPTANDWKY
jgi:hypothetical protein